MLKAAPSTAYGCSPSTRRATPRAARVVDLPVGGLRDDLGPVTGVLRVRATGSTTVRVTWTADPAAGLIPSRARSLRGWSDETAVDRSGSGADHVIRRYRVDGLRGPRLAAAATRFNGSSEPDPPGYNQSLPSRAYLTLGERGAGPRAPSDLDWVLESNRVRLSWKDNSSDELGFEVQVRRWTWCLSSGEPQVARGCSRSPRTRNRPSQTYQLSDRPKALPGLRLQRPRVLCQHAARPAVATGRSPQGVLRQRRLLR